MISFDQGKTRWQWDIDSIDKLAVTDNVVDLMLDKITLLPLTTQHVLSLAACIGGQFDLNTLSVACGEPQQNSSEKLWEALRAELVIPMDEAYKYVGIEKENAASETKTISPVYRFGHDRIQQAAYQLIPDAGESGNPLADRHIDARFMFGI